MKRIDRDQIVPVTIELNGVEVTGNARSRMLLTDFLREQIGATGTHVGCEHGVCGCCTVMIDGIACRGCLTLAVQADGRRVDTVESLADEQGRLNVLQTAFRKYHALQCGFCTPGILMSFTDYLKRNPSPSEPEVREVLGGHICRCTGYEGLVTAILEAAETLRGERKAGDDADVG